MKKFILALTYTLATLFSTPGLTAERISTADLIEGISTSKNFLKDKGHFEKNANGFSSYADAAGTAPVDGTGGTATNTCTRTTSSPLAGDGSFLITHAGTNRQGDGCSASFSIDSSAKGKALQIKFDYAVASGTMADTDQSVWVYDVTNSRLIQPAGSAILNSGITESKTLTFQSSIDSTSYRLIFHTSSTSTTSYTLKIDDIIVRPIVAVSGASITDWQTYTPTFTGCGTVTNTLSFKWRQVGDTMEIQGYFNCAVPAASVASFTLPNSLTASVAAGGNDQSVGVWQNNDGSGTRPKSGHLLAVDSGNIVYFGSGDYTPAVSGQTHQNGSTIATSATQLFWVNANLKITGWGSSQVLSSDTDTRVVAFKATKGSAQAIGSGTTAKIQWDTVAYDTHGAYDAVTNYRYTVKVPGKYRVASYFEFQSSFSASSIQMQVYKNGSGIETIYRNNNSVGDVKPSGSTTVDLVAGDYIEIYLVTGTQAVTVDSGVSRGALTIERLSGPAQIAASESVIASYQVGSGQSLTSTGIIKADTKLIDTHNAYSTSTGIFTAPISGSYRISGAFFSITATSTWDVIIRKNSGNIARCNISPVYAGGTASANNNSVCTFSATTLSMKAGDTIDFYNNDAVGVGTLYASSLDNWILIERVGY